MVTLHFYSELVELFLFIFRDLKWICIWCRKYSENFAQINIDDGVGTSVDGDDGNNKNNGTFSGNKTNPWLVHLILHKTIEV